MKRGLFVVLVVMIVLVAAGGVLWAFGTPQAAPPPPAGATRGERGAGSGAPGGESATSSRGTGTGTMPAMGGGDPSAIGKEAPPPDPNSPLAIQIPGCTCHSDDPKLVEEHAEYRMNQCFGCHSGAQNEQ